MIFKFKENQCLLEVLRILNKNNTTYGKFYKETKVSHTTLQRVLYYLIDKKFVNKTKEGYKLNNRGKLLLEKLNEINSILT